MKLLPRLPSTVPPPQSNNIIVSKESRLDYFNHAPDTLPELRSLFIKLFLSLLAREDFCGAERGVSYVVGERGDTARTPPLLLYI